MELVDVGGPTILIGAGYQLLHLRLDEQLPRIRIDAPFGSLTPFGWTCVAERKSNQMTLRTQQHASEVCRSDKQFLVVQKLCYSVQESPMEALLLR